MRVADLPEEAVLLQDAQEVRAVLEHLGKEELLAEYPSLFVLLDAGEYRKVWGITSAVPYPGPEAEEIYG